MATLNPFEASRIKLRRARYHIGDLTEQIRTYLRREPFYLEIADGFEPGGKKWVLRVRDPVPLDFAAIIGDVVHNLRTSLDVMACDLVRLNGKSDENVYFPFAKTAAGLEAMINKRNFDRAKPEAIDLVRSLKPYKGGNHALRAIHDLDVEDKHRALLPISDMVSAPLPPGVMPGSHGIKMGPIRDGMAIRATGNDVLLANGTRAWAGFTLAFDIFDPAIAGLKQVPLGGGEVIPTLNGLAQLVDSIIEAFAAL